MEHKVMSYRSHFQALLVLGLPLIGGHLAQFAIGLTDTAMLGRYSAEALAAAVLGNTLFFVTFILGSGFAIAVMPMVAEADATGDEVQIRRITRMGMWLSAGYAVLIFPLFWWSGAFLKALGQQPDLSDQAQAYLRIVGFGLMPALLTNVLKSYLAALERTRVVFWITVLAAVVNAAVNYVLIFGKFGAPELGIIGAAIASLVVQVVSIAGVVLYALRVLPEHAMFQRIWKADNVVLVKVFRLGLPIGLTVLSEVTLFAFSTTMMGWLGTVPLVAHGIAINIAGLAFMMHLGLSSAATVRAGNALGRKDYEHLAKGARMAIWMSLGFSVVAVTVMVSIPQALIALFLSSDDPNYEAVLSLGAQLMLLAALFQFVDGAQAMALGLLRGVLDTKWPMVLAAVSYWLVGMSIGYSFGFPLGYKGVGVWFGLVAGLACAAILLMWRFWRHIMVDLRASAERAHAS